MLQLEWAVVVVKNTWNIYNTSFSLSLTNSCCRQLNALALRCNVNLLCRFLPQCIVLTSSSVLKLWNKPFPSPATVWSNNPSIIIGVPTVPFLKSCPVYHLLPFYITNAQSNVRIDFLPSLYPIH
jgi:hypothetical protein